MYKHNNRICLVSHVTGSVEELMCSGNFKKELSLNMSPNPKHLTPNELSMQKQLLTVEFTTFISLEPERNTLYGDVLKINVSHSVQH